VIRQMAASFGVNLSGTLWDQGLSRSKACLSYLVASSGAVDRINQHTMIN
jgi:hypothetical protein